MDQAILHGCFSRTKWMWWMYQPRLAQAWSDQPHLPYTLYHVFQQMMTVWKSNPICPSKTTKQICLIHLVKGNKITMIAQEKKIVLCWHPFAGKQDWKERVKAIWSDYARAYLAQYIHHTLFVLLNDKRSKFTIIAREKNRVLHQHPFARNMTWRKGWRTAVLSTLGLIQASTSITPILTLFPAASWTPCLYTILVMSLILKRKQNKPSILEIFRYRNETNWLIPDFFKIEAERTFDPHNFCYQNETNHHIPEFFKIEAN
jgi:hypothetical protein